MNDIVEKIEGLIEEAKKVSDNSPFAGNGISALNSARDNFKWAIEAVEKKAKGKKKEAPEPAATAK
jgi:hypothetical protein